MHFERQICLSNCIKLYFSEIKIIKKIYVCLPYLKCSDPLPETHLFFTWPKGSHFLRSCKLRILGECLLISSLPGKSENAC